MSPAAGPNHRRTAAYSTPTQATPSSACGTSTLQELTPKIRPDSSITHSEAGVLSTVMKLDGVEGAEEERLPAPGPGVDRGGVEVVGPAVPAEVDQVQERGQRQQPDQGGPGPARVGVRPAQQPFRCGRARAGGPSPGARPAVVVAVNGCSRRWRPRVSAGGRGADVPARGRNTHVRYSRNRSAVATRLAATSTAHLGAAARRGDGRVQPGQRARGEREPGGERDQALDLVPGSVRAPADAEGQPPVGGGVGHGRDEQAERVGGLGRHRRCAAAGNRRCRPACWPRRWR